MPKFKKDVKEGKTYHYDYNATRRLNPSSKYNDDLAQRNGSLVVVIKRDHGLFHGFFVDDKHEAWFHETELT